jgi:hypothetical protein
MQVEATEPLTGDSTPVQAFTPPPADPLHIRARQWLAFTGGLLVVVAFVSASKLPSAAIQRARGLFVQRPSASRTETEMATPIQARAPLRAAAPVMATPADEPRVAALLKDVDKLLGEAKVPIDALDEIVKAMQAAGVTPSDTALLGARKVNFLSVLDDWRKDVGYVMPTDLLTELRGDYIMPQDLIGAMRAALQGPDPLAEAFKKAGVTPPASLLADLTKALQEAGVQPPAAVLYELATALVVDELVLQELADGLGEGSKAEAIWKPDDIDREHLAKNVTKALKSAHPEVATTMSTCASEDVLREGAKALTGVQLADTQLRDLAKALREAGVLPANPVLRELAADFDSIWDLVGTHPEGESASKTAAEEAWRVAAEEAYRLSSTISDDAWRITAERIREVTEDCIDECDITEAFAEAYAKQAQPAKM